MNKIKWSTPRPPGFYDAVLVPVDEFEKKITKRWHLSTLQLSLVLAVNGAFWLIVGLLVSVRILL